MYDAIDCMGKGSGVVAVIGGGGGVYIAGTCATYQGCSIQIKPQGLICN